MICVSQVTADALVCQLPRFGPRWWWRPTASTTNDSVPRRNPTEPTASLLGSLGVPVDRQLVVFVGTLEPRKGIVPLVAAFDRLAARRPDTVLVLAGQPGWGMADTERALAQARHGDRIVRTGYVPDAAVPALLRRAAVATYPALEEGFGLPALEALACGAPLVTTQGTAMAEFAGGAALLVPPGDVPALADALGPALDHGRGTERRELGISVAAARTWEASAERHLRAYEVARAGSQ